MEMDDPWGSPWADEIQPPNPVSTKESYDVGVVQRPKTPVKASSLALQEKTSSSPWDDLNDAEDGFGDWAADPGTGLNGAEDDGWGRNLGNDIRFTKPDTNGFSEAWNTAPAIQQEDTLKLGPSGLPKSTGIVRQPALDPWAFDGPVDEPKPSYAETTGQETGEEANDTTLKDLGWESEENHHATNGDSQAWPETKDLASGGVAAEVDEADHSKADGLKGHTLEAVNDTIGHTEVDSQAHNESTGAGLELLPGAEDTIPFEQQDSGRPEGRDESKESEKLSNGPERASTSHEADPMSSRPSSSPSERSQHDDILSESPRTSLEEDPKRPQIPRKASSKVQELVEHFDTLAQKEETPSMISGRTSAAEVRVEVTAQPEDDAEDLDDFGDFEDGQSEIDEPHEESETIETSATPATPESKVSPKAPEAALSLSPEQRTLGKEYGPVDFIVDASRLSKLYPQDGDEASTESILIPDRAPHDSFTSTEQRKTWYRLSRYGPMRKHNMGDDENYTRVNWTQSEIKVETLKIVARWIEEDRMSGRVMLGGGSKAGSMFGWNDQKAAPTSISAAFASKATKKKAETAPVAPAVEVPREWPQGLVKERQSSKNRSPSKARRRSSVKSVKTPEEVKGSPVANFGWNVVPESSQKSHSRNTSSKGSFGSLSNAIPLTNSPSPTQKRASPSRSSSTTSRPTDSIQKKPSPATNILLPPLHSKTVLSPIAPTPAAAEFFDGEDDWGEMISSPIASTPPVLPQPNGLRHKKSQSLIGNFSSATASMPSIVPRQSMDSAQTHRPMASFDDILKTKKNSPQSAKPPETFSAFSNLSSAFASPTSQTAATQPAAAGSSDPWDLSFFDTPPAPAAPSQASPLPKSTPLKTVSFTNTRATPALPAIRKSKEELEQERIVQSVIKGLPDISYMLRR